MRTHQQLLPAILFCPAAMIVMAAAVDAAGDELSPDIKCVVCDKPADAKFFPEYKGGRVYLACPNCVATFKADPRAFADKALAQLAATDQVKPSTERDERSVRPGINKRFVDPDLKVSEWLGRFEVESREVFANRADVVKACGIKPGQHVADIGAGTGFFSRLFAEAVGREGEVSAVDISPRFLAHITVKAREQKVTNLTTVLCTDRSVKLPPASVDVAFVCDTYHHFEFPRSTLATIRQALRPGGTLIVIDFERIPGESREFILNHVRAGKDVFRSEVLAAGFELVEEVDISGFKENYFLRFRKAPAEQSKKRRSVDERNKSPR